MNITRGLVLSAALGALGTGGWVFLSKSAGTGLGVLACVVGAMCGVGMSGGLRAAGGIRPGLVAATTACVCILAGRLTILALNGPERDTRMEALSESDAIEALAGEIEAERQGATGDGARALAAEKWGRMTERERAAMLGSLARERARLQAESSRTLMASDFVFDIFPYGAMWIGVGGIIAFSLASHKVEEMMPLEVSERSKAGELRGPLAALSALDEAPASKEEPVVSKRRAGFHDEAA